MLLASLVVGMSLLGQYKAKQPPLIAALLRCDAAAVKSSLEFGVRPTLREIVTSAPNATLNEPGGVESPGRSALWIAVDEGSVECLKHLLDAKADPNEAFHSWTPLQSACQDGQFEIVRLLLRYGAKPNLINGHGDTAIIYSAERGDLKSVKLLVEAGADLNGGSGESALIAAIRRDELEVIRFLLRAGANPNFHRSGWRTPLEYAVTEFSMSDDAIAKMLVKAGAKGRPKDVLKAEDKLAREAYLRDTNTRTASIEEEEPGIIKPTQDDTDVIRAVLGDLAEGSEMFVPPGLKGGNKIILFAEGASLSKARQATVEQSINSELNDREANDLDLPMRRDFLAKIGRNFSLTPSDFSNPRVMVAPVGTIFARDNGFSFAKESKGKAIIRTFLPGFSADKTRAFLRFGIGIMEHGASGTVFLKKSNGKWKVVWREFSYYV